MIIIIEINIIIIVNIGFDLFIFVVVTDSLDRLLSIEAQYLHLIALIFIFSAQKGHLFITVLFFLVVVKTTINTKTNRMNKNKICQKLTPINKDINIQSIVYFFKT